MPYEITNPRWSSAISIDVDWNHPDFGPIPFTVVNGNIEPWTGEPDYMRDIWDGLMRGDFGQIAPMEPQE